MPVDVTHQEDEAGGSPSVRSRSGRVPIPEAGYVIRWSQRAGFSPSGDNLGGPSEVLSVPVAVRTPPATGTGRWRRLRRMPPCRGRRTARTRCRGRRRPCPAGRSVIGRHHRFKGVTHRAGLARHLGWIRRSADTPRAQAVAPTRSGGTGQHVRLDTEPIPSQGPLKLDGKNRSSAPTTTRIGTDGHASKLQTDPKTASASGSGEALPCLALHARIVSTTSGHGVAERFAPSPPGGHREGRALRRR